VRVLHSHPNTTMSLRSRVFKFLDNNDVTDVKRVYKEYPEENKSTLERYFYVHRKLNIPDISIDLINLDTIKEMELSINKIKDPVKRCENLSRLHSMKLKPLPNKSQMSLKEMFDAS